MQLLPHFGARALTAVQKIDQSKNVYVRIRTGPRRSQMKVIGRVELVAGEGFEVMDMMTEVQKVIADGGSHQGHVVELMEYDPNGRAIDAIHTVYVPPTVDDRTAESMAHIDNGETNKALVAAVVTMAQSADARAERYASMHMELMKDVGDARVAAVGLQHELAAGAPPVDDRMKAMALFMSVIAPLLPGIQQRMQADHALKTGAPVPEPAPEPEPDVYEAATEGEVADALLASLGDLSKADPTIWEDPERKAAAMSIYLAMQADQAAAGEGETGPEPAGDGDPDLTDAG